MNHGVCNIQCILIYLEKEIRILALIWLIREAFEGGNQLWTFLWSKRLWISESLRQRFHGIQAMIMYRVVIHSYSLCASFFNVRFIISAHWAEQVRSPQFLYAIYISYGVTFQLKREISRTLTFCLYYANKFVERYEKTITDFTQFAFNVRRKVQIKPSMEFCLFILT